MAIEKGWIVALILVGVLGGSNLIMYLLVRGAFRSDEKGVFKKFTENLTLTHKSRESQVEELSRKVRELQGKRSDEEETTR